MTKRPVKYCLGFFFLLIAGTNLTFAGAPSYHDVEVLQANATLQYHSNDYKGAVRTLQLLLAKSSLDVEALALLALCQRRLDDDDAALTTYRKLMPIAPPERKPAYRFEVATILMKHKKFALAREYYISTAEAGFNPGMSRFFIGLIDFNNKNWQSARANFTDSLAYDDAKLVYQTAHYYLASTDEQLGLTDPAIHNYFAATIPGTDSLSGDVRENALKTLRRLNHAQSFEMLTLISQYDTNVQANPSDVPNPVPQSMQSSMKSILNAAFGYVSPPVKKVQAIASLGMFGNYDWNEVTRDYQFASVTPSLVGMFSPYQALSFGLKASGTYTMKNTVDASTPTTGNNYESFSATGDIGPLMRYDLTPTTRLALEATWRPKEFFQDAPTGDTRRTGMGYFMRGSAEYSRSAYLNVLGYVSFEQDIPQGSAYRFTSPGLGIANAMHLSDKFTLTPMFDFTHPNYYQTVNPVRVDTYYSLRVTAQYVLTGHWSLLADAGYILNRSTVPATFQYNRTVASLGASYFF